MSIFKRLGPPFIVLALAASLSGCGTYIAAKSVTGAGSLVVGGAVGAVKLTGKAVGTTAGAVASLGRDEPDESW